MNAGKIPEHNLERAVLKNIKKINNISVGSGIGNDYSCLGDIITADGTGSLPVIAWAKAINNFCTSGGKPEIARVCIFLRQGTKENSISRYMEEFSQLSEQSGIQICGGNTEIISGIEDDTFVVTVIGHKSSWSANKKAISENSSIIMVGYAGILGTNLLLTENKDKIEKSFGSYFSKGYVFAEKDYISQSIISEDHELNQNVLYMHDVSTSGVYSALWEMGKCVNRGMLIKNEAIPIRQETIEICELLDLNPYLIDGTGAMLMVCNNASEVLQSLKEKGFHVAIIGRITAGKEKLVSYGDDEKRTLSAFEAN